jgi:ABC-type Fe3+-hydroxamate transport system substrate-binding protein
VSKKGPILKKLAEFISQKLIKEKSKLEEKNPVRVSTARSDGGGTWDHAHGA